MMNGVFDWMARWYHHEDGHSLCHRAKLHSVKSRLSLCTGGTEIPPTLRLSVFCSVSCPLRDRYSRPLHLRRKYFYILIWLLRSDCSENDCKNASETDAHFVTEKPISAQI